MLKLIAIIVLAGLSQNAAAFWIKIRNAGVLLQYDFYADPATLRKNRDIARIQTLSDYKTLQMRTSGYRYMSLTAVSENDCKTKQSRTASTILYEKSMGTGFSIDTNADTPSWAPLAPGSPEEAVWKMACGAP